MKRTTKVLAVPLAMVLALALFGAPSTLAALGQSHEARGVSPGKVCVTLTLGLPLPYNPFVDNIMRAGCLALILPSVWTDPSP